jgi:hypothetical protein
MKLELRPTPLTDGQIIPVTIDPDGDAKLIEAVPAEFARKMERERDYMIRNNNKVRADLDAVAKEACQLQDALGFPCEIENAQEKAMERLRDLIASEGELGDAKEKIESLELECARLHKLWADAHHENECCRIAMCKLGAAFAGETLSSVIVNTIEVIGKYRESRKIS